MRLLASLGLVVLLLATAGTASAALTVAVEGLDSTPLTPDVETRAVTVVATAACGDFPPAAVEEGAAMVRVSFADVPPGVLVEGPGAIPVDLGACVFPGDEASGSAAFGLAATRHVPGLKAMSFRVLADADAALPPLYPALAAETEAPFVVGYYPLLAATVPSKVLETQPGGLLTYTIDLQNHGNAATRVEPAIVTPPTGGFAVQAPEAIVLEAGATGRMEVKVRAAAAEGWTNEASALTLQLTPVAALDTDAKGDPVTVHLMARSRGYGDGTVAMEGEGQDAPAGGVLAVVPALALAGWVGKRRRA